MANSLGNSLRSVSHIVFYENLASMLAPADFVELFLQLPLASQGTLLSGVLSLLIDEKEAFRFPEEIKTLLSGVVLELLKRQPLHFLPGHPLAIQKKYPLLLASSLIRWCLSPLSPKLSKYNGIPFEFFLLISLTFFLVFFCKLDPLLNSGRYYWRPSCLRHRLARCSPPITLPSW